MISIILESFSLEMDQVADERVKMRSPPLQAVLPSCVCDVPDVAAMPVTWKLVGLRLNTAKVKFLPAAVNPDSWSAGHTHWRRKQ